MRLGYKGPGASFNSISNELEKVTAPDKNTPAAGNIQGGSTNTEPTFSDLFVFSSLPTSSLGPSLLNEKKKIIYRLTQDL